MNFKFQLGDHMVRAGFPSGDLIPAHMLSFKNLNVRLGLLCLTALAIFIDLKKRLPGRGPTPPNIFINAEDLTATSNDPPCSRFFPLHLGFIVHEFTDGDGPLVFSYLSSTSSSPYLVLPKLAKL